MKIYNVFKKDEHNDYFVFTVFVIYVCIVLSAPKNLAMSRCDTYRLNWLNN